MNELIKVTVNEHQEQTVSARELHEKLGIVKRFSAWWEDQVSRLNLIEDVDYTLYLEVHPQNHQQMQDFMILIDTAKHLAMISGGEKAHEIRQYFIKVEKAWNDPEMVMARAQQIAQRKLLSYEEKVKALETRVALDAPKVIFADAVSASHTTILVGELAKIMKQNGIDMGEKRLFQWLRENGYLIKRKGTDYNSPTQLSMNLELFTVKETAVTHSDGHVTVNKTTKVTGKGQQYFINKFLASERSVLDGTND